MVKKLNDIIHCNKDCYLEKGKTVVVPSSTFKDKTMQYMHHNTQAGHVGYHTTLQRPTLDFYWEGMRGDNKKFVKECDVC